MVDSSHGLTSRMAGLRLAEGVAVATCLALGWLATGQQLRGEGGGSGSTWMVVLAGLATLGALAWAACRRRAPGLGIVGALVLVAVSPVVFAYPVTLVVLGLAVAELVLAVRARIRAGHGSELDLGAVSG